ncbi:hypothetical protein EDD86DRAFT_244630 [Gorgonomyces haynaldii]|nr:hypothetical protein EDD86DRAFT_244630 [Gorgonomyces haynaldii]
MDRIKQLLKPKTFKPPPSALLNRIQDFLPQLDQANKALKPEDNLETVDEDEQHIEMNLDLGVYDVKLLDEPDNEAMEIKTQEHVEDLDLQTSVIPSGILIEEVTQSPQKRNRSKKRSKSKISKGTAKKTSAK